MKTYYANVIQFRGDHRSFGFNQGEWLRKSSLYQIYTDPHITRKLRFSVDRQESVAWLTELFPEFLEELMGLAEGLKLTIDETILHFSGYQQEWKRSGCTIFTGDHYMVRNYDYHPKTYEGRVVLYQPNLGYAA